MTPPVSSVLFVGTDLIEWPSLVAAFCLGVALLGAWALILRGGGRGE